MTGFHGEPRRVRGFGLLPWSNCVHYERQGSTRTAFHRFLGEGMATGYAAEDSAALHFTGTELSAVVASRPSARCFRVTADGARTVEMRLATRYLGDAAAVPQSREPKLAA